ncbi:hypothetical protein CALVIDRAFT_332800 [Calocera viscosa TUFC12733]|uniref:Secreted protein n=1 Tax=Calocera viscosa (strain TUFC12733) TaxID=1330018 RepID=A0A167HQB1_CALVF|nr:hypothetical protein CALVIDRAFT_332800 [Calocera viscosa TUFC12733]
MPICLWRTSLTTRHLSSYAVLIPCCLASPSTSSCCASASSTAGGALTSGFSVSRDMMSLLRGMCSYGAGARSEEDDKSSPSAPRTSPNLLCPPAPTPLIRVYAPCGSFRQKKKFCAHSSICVRSGRSRRIEEGLHATRTRREEITAARTGRMTYLHVPSHTWGHRASSD